MNRKWRHRKLNVLRIFFLLFIYLLNFIFFICHFFYISFYISFFYFKLIFFHFFHVNMTMSRFYRSTHERSDIATYAETQRRLKLITSFNVDFNVNFNVDSNLNLDLDESNSNFFFTHFVFTSFLICITSFRIHIISFENLQDKKAFSDKRLFSEKKLSDDKKLSRKIYKVKSKKKITHVINKFYDSLYDNSLTMLCFVNLIINKALREIKILQRVTNLLISRLFFQKVMKNIMRDQTTKDLRIQRSAVDALQEAIEEFLVRTFENKLIVHTIWYIV